MDIFDEVPCITGAGLTIKRITDTDSDGLTELVNDETVYRYLPTFLFEKKYDDIHYVIKQIHDECFAARDSVIMGIYPDSGNFCGIAEIYGVNCSMHKVSVGYRLLRRFWGKGIATEAVSLLVGYLYSKTDTEIITASTMIENKASARVLEKNGFIMTASSVDEDWGYEHMTKADKWFR